MPTSYPPQRPLKTPPHTSLRNLRRVAGLTLEQVCEAVTEITGASKPMTRGALSAIESGLRGPSQQTLDALAVAYGLDPGDLVTDFEPRAREAVSV
jgi:transcriptional regulator with XRE-family HTH domain